MTAATSPVASFGVAHDPDVLARLIDRFQVVAKMRMFHWQRVTLGVFGALVATSYNLWHHSVAPWMTASTGAIIGGIFVLLGAGLLWIRSETARRAVHRSSAQPRDQILQAVECIERISNAWLLWAAAGHVLICIATILRARWLVPPESNVLWLAMTPTFGLIAYGFLFVPTRERLVNLLGEGAVFSIGARPAVGNEQ